MGPCKGLTSQLSRQLWAHSMPSVVMVHGPMQRSRLAALPLAMGPFNVIGQSMGPSKGLTRQLYGSIQCHR
jgi:hypothetical protein